MKSGIYVITNMKNLKCYVGSTLYFNSRFAKHRHMLRNNIHGNKKLQEDWNQFGEAFFYFEQVEECPVDQLLIREQFWMDDMRVFELGYNLTRQAGTSLGHKHSEETKKELAQLKKNPSPETRKRMSEAKRGSKNPNYKKPFSPEVKERLFKARDEYWKRQKQQKG